MLSLLAPRLVSRHHSNLRHELRQISFAARAVSIAPSALQPYLKLARADKPIGTWLLYWPCTWSIALAAPAGQLPDLRLLALFGTGAFLMRGAGCVINDLWDRDYDRQVERTRTRPLASGELSSTQGVALLGGLLTSSLGILLQLNPATIALGFASMIPVICYPLAKRFTYWPQAVLGLTFNFGALMGYTAATGHFDPLVSLPLYASAICWTLVYDTIYAFQDKDDDILVGIKSTALRFADNWRPWMGGFSTAFIGGLAATGLVNGQTWPFFAAVAASSGHLAWQLSKIQPDSRNDCWSKFASNNWIGFFIFSGIVAGTLLKSPSKEDPNPKTSHSE
uniref:4-hydroxybenzoate polyprenyltransferase, mitochondrial n=1 Tax=Panagrellus redivivus TaxID=6233 RepID=A0A7E4UP68_PANRE